MPTVLYMFGWRLFFYSNEGSEPIHIHAEKGEMECKYWINVEEIEIRERRLLDEDLAVDYLLKMAEK